MSKKLSLKEKSVAEIQKLLTEKREELRTLRFSAAGARAKDTNGPKKARTVVAQALTELSARKNA